MKITPKRHRIVFGILVGLAGCVRPGGDSLVIATSWPESERRAVEADFRPWLRSHHPELGEPNPIVWVGLTVGEDPARVVGRGAVDVVLGGPAESYRRQGQAWCVARRSPIGLAVARESSGRRPPSAWSDLAEPRARRRVALDDVRHDPVAFAWAKARLADQGWETGYGELVRTAGNARRIGRGAGSALASIGHQGAALTPGTADQVAHRDGIGFIRFADSPEWVEGAGVAEGVRNAKLAQAFVQFLRERPSGEDLSSDAPLIPSPTRGEGDIGGISSKRDDLLTDLLGATLVDAHDELESAWGALIREGRPPHWERWLVQAPPWPPASIMKMKERGEDAELTDLAAQIAPEPDVRAWLLTSWERPVRPIGDALFHELAGAVDGRLVGEPRFRAWLREEWTEWARQRYRRVERMAGEPPR